MPSIVIVASEPNSRAELAAAIERRFGSDYTVVSLDLSEVSSEVLDVSRPIAIALAPIGGGDFSALDLVGVHEPGARRIAVVRVGDTSVAQALSQALTLGQVDYYVGQPWASPEEDALGTPFIVMERLPGRVFVVWEPHSSFSRDLVQLREVWLQAARMLARLHMVDWQTALQRRGG